MTSSAMPVQLPELAPADIRAAIAFASAKGKPLLPRRSKGRLKEPVIVAFDMADGTFELGGAELSDGLVPRRVHLEWIREQLQHNDEPPEALSRALGTAKAQALLGAAPLDARVYAKVYRGPKSQSKRTLDAWLEKTIDFFAMEDEHSEAMLYFLEAHGPSSIAFWDVISRIPNPAIWHDPDTGAEVGRVSTSAGGPGYDDVTVASNAVAVTCLQRTAELLAIRLRVEVRS